MLKLVTVVGLMCCVSTIAAAQAQSALSIADNDSVYIDGQTFQVVPGKAKGDTAAQIKALGARSLDSDAVIFRSGGRLYIAYALATPNERMAYLNPPDACGLRYASNPADCNSTFSGPINYGVDPNSRTITYSDGMVVPNPADRFAVWANDPDYAQYRLKNAFENGWTPGGTK
jgi:hypothetical protein